jgi:hypothetical protein
MIVKSSIFEIPEEFEYPVPMPDPKIGFEPASEILIVILAFVIVTLTIIDVPEERAEPVPIPEP